MLSVVVEPGTDVTPTNATQVLLLHASIRYPSAKEDPVHVKSTWVEETAIARRFCGAGGAAGPNVVAVAMLEGGESPRAL